MFKTSLFVLLALYIHNSSCIVDDLYDAGKMLWHLYSILDKISLEDDTNAAKIAEIFTFGSVNNQEIKTQMNEIFSKLDEIEESINPEKISDSLKLSSSSFVLRTRVDGLQVFLDEIDLIYREFKKYMKGEYDNSENALGELVQRIIADIVGDITWLQKLVIGESIPLLNNVNIIEAISVDAARRRHELCDGPQLASSILAQLFKMVVMAEIKTNFMLSLANIYQYGRKHDGWNAMNTLAGAEFERNFARYVAVFARAMSTADELYFRACDPVNGIWIRDQNFYELDNTVQNTISLSTMQSTIESNWVITGFRFVRKNGILHIQPREGRLKANGYILPSNQRWIPLPNDPLVHTIDRENRVFFLDDLRLPSFHALTGVRFIKQIRGGITGFALEIFGVPFSYNSGYCTSKGVSVKNPDTTRGSLIKFKKVPPTLARVRYTPTLSPSGYVYLERSESSADFGRSTLPFFDAVPIVPSPPSVLDGIGIFHKAAYGYSGFISLKLFGIRYNAYLSDFRVSFNSSEHH